jgi:hypothetical protein
MRRMKRERRFSEGCCCIAIFSGTLQDFLQTQDVTTLSLSLTRSYKSFMVDNGQFSEPSELRVLPLP